MARRLAEPDISRNHRGKDLAGEMAADLLGDLRGEVRSAVVHGKKDAENAERGVESALDRAHRRHQVRQALQRVVFALDGD